MRGKLELACFVDSMHPHKKNGTHAIDTANGESQKLVYFLLCACARVLLDLHLLHRKLGTLEMPAVGTAQQPMK